MTPQAKATEGHVKGVPLSSMLQIVEQDRKTCTLEVVLGLEKGFIYFEDGRVVHAETGSKSAIDAIYELVNWGDEVEIHLKPDCEPVARTIDRPLSRLLLEGFARHDESRRDLTLLSSEPFEEAASDAAATDRQIHPFAAEEGSGDEADLSLRPETHEEPEMKQLQDILDAFRDEVPEFISTDLVNIDSGLSIGGTSTDPEFDASLASASYAEVVKANRRALEFLGLGAESTEDVLITTDRVYILIRMLGGEYYHLLAITRKGNLGLARAIMKRSEAALLKSIGGLSG